MESPSSENSEGPPPWRRQRNRWRLVLAFGLASLVLGLLSPVPSYFLPCNSPGFLLCGPLSSDDFLVRTTLICIGIILLSVAVGMWIKIRGREGPSAPVASVNRLSRPSVRARLGLQNHAIVIGLAIGIVLSGALATVPMRQAFVMPVAYFYDLESTCGGILPTEGTLVTFNWSTPSPNTFFVVDCANSSPVLVQYGTAGAGSFIAGVGPYAFGASCPGSGTCVPARVNGTFYAPLLLYV